MPPSLEKKYDLRERCEKALCAKGNFAFEELCQLALDAGFEFKSQEGSSHKIYKHPEYVMNFMDCMNFQSVKGKAKPYQIKQLVQFIKEARPKR